MSIQLIGPNAEHCLEGLATLMRGDEDPFRVLAIIGSQSSGKSTLLNALFQLDFQVLDSENGQRQTTEGIWLGRSKDNLVLDVEGMDSGQQADRASWEHRAAAFCLGLADCVVMNLWYHQLGLGTGSNIPLLSRIMQLAPELLGPETGRRRIQLIFLIRDYPSRGATPRNKIIGDIRTRLEGDAATRNASTHFDICFEFLPHFLEWPEDFKTAVDEMSRRWQIELPRRTERVYRWSQFPETARLLWSQLENDVRLDIPSFETMLSRVMCQSQMQRTAEEVVGQLKFQEIHRRGKLEQAKWSISPLVESALSRFDRETSIYDEEVCAEYRTQLRMILTNRCGDIAFNLAQSEIRRVSQNTENEGFNGFWAHLRWQDFQADTDERLRSLNEVGGFLAESSVGIAGTSLPLFSEHHRAALRKLSQDEVSRLTDQANARRRFIPWRQSRRC